MGKGKYSPSVYGKDFGPYEFNCFGDQPAPWPGEPGTVYDEKTMFANYDKQGFDSYGYSAFNEDGQYVGVGRGVDRNGYTENEYLSMDDDEYDSFF